MVTEKSTNLTKWNNQYVFIVDRRANKMDVRNAIQSKWNVHVTEVRMINKQGKLRRIRYNRWGKEPAWKKAIVKLKKDEVIEIF
jgi:large subunit ribosomal protein L23